jgi:hypothetical protein
VNDLRWWYDLLTGTGWLALALIGIVLRCRRLVRLHHIVLVEPIDPRDELYLEQVKRSTYLRLGVKAVLLIGALIAVFDLTLLWWLWRLGLIVILVLMVAETSGVDHVRDVLGRNAGVRP